MQISRKAILEASGAWRDAKANCRGELHKHLRSYGEELGRGCYWVREAHSHLIPAESFWMRKKVVPFRDSMFRLASQRGKLPEAVIRKPQILRNDRSLNRTDDSEVDLLKDVGILLVLALVL